MPACRACPDLLAFCGSSTLSSLRLLSHRGYALGFWAYLGRLYRCKDSHGASLHACVRTLMCGFAYSVRVSSLISTYISDDTSVYMRLLRFECGQISHHRTVKEGRRKGRCRGKGVSADSHRICDTPNTQHISCWQQHPAPATCGSKFTHYLQRADFPLSLLHNIPHVT